MVSLIGVEDPINVIKYVFRHMIHFPKTKGLNPQRLIYIPRETGCQATFVVVTKYLLGNERKRHLFGVTVLIKKDMVH